MTDNNLHPRLKELLGQVVGERYLLEEVVGRGGMGVVFRARHLSLRQTVAVKVLHPRLSLDPEIAGRFDREARIASCLDHANCVRVVDYGTADNGCKFMVMPWVDGTPFAERLGHGPMAAVVAVGYALQILRGLKHAHALGVVHRDLKPENLIVTHDKDGIELLKITDFGIAKIVRGQGSLEHVTRVGLVPGTPEYMSPEHAKGQTLDGRSDLYCAGLILYEMLAGRQAFSHRSPAQVMHMQVYDAPPPLPSSVPLPLVAIVAELLRKNPDDRYFDALGVLQALSDDGLQRAIQPPTPRGLWARLRRAVGRSTVAEPLPARA